MAAITLLQFAGPGGLSLSPYCNKVHWALRLKGLLYRTVDVVRPGAVSATGRLPVLLYDGARVHDSTDILRLLDERHPTPPLVPAERAAAAQAHVLEEWADEALHPVVAYYRWRDRAALGDLARHALPLAPPGLARLAMHVPRLRARRAHAGLVRRGEGYVAAQLARHLDALEALLGARAWLVGDAPSVADIAVAAQLHVLTLGQSPDALAQVRARPALAAWLERFLARAASGGA